jgi:hypothetical protein
MLMAVARIAAPDGGARDFRLSIRPDDHEAIEALSDRLNGRLLEGGLLGVVRGAVR